MQLHTSVVGKPRIPVSHLPFLLCCLIAAHTGGRPAAAQSQRSSLKAGSAQQLQDGGSSSKAEAVQQCLNAPGCHASTTTWDHMLEDRPSCLTAHKTWWSSDDNDKPSQVTAGGSSSPFPVTLVTQLSLNRLPQLRAQCATWRGPLAAVVYLPLLREGGEEEGGGEGKLSTAAAEKLQAAAAEVEELIQWASSPASTGAAAAAAAASVEGRCRLRIALMYEIFQQERAASVLYPVNALRNYARLMADTPLIANIDVDMLPSLSLSASLAEPERARAYVDGCTKEGAVYVVPAFETNCGGPSFADKAALLGKEGLPELIDQECLSRFRWDTGLGFIANAYCTVPPNSHSQASLLTCDTCT